MVKFSPGKITALFVFALLLASCRENTYPDPEPLPVIVPETYGFQNVDLSAQGTLIRQLEELVTYVKTANEWGVTLDLAVLDDMFANKGGNGGGNFSFTSEEQLEELCFGAHRALIRSYFEVAVAASQSNNPASDGVAGRMTNGTEHRLVDEYGVEFAEYIEKSIMGAVFYYQVMGVHLADEAMDADNVTVTEGRGTEMQQHWDQAYGFLGVTTEFPENTEDAKFWGKYCVGRDAVLGTVDELGYAFRQGRKAINIGRYDVRDEAIDKISAAWEKVAAGSAIHFLNAAIEGVSDDFARNHFLSEGTAFITSLYYNPKKTITETQLLELQFLIGSNFYEATTEKLVPARNRLAEIYGLEEVQTEL